MVLQDRSGLRNGIEGYCIKAPWSASRSHHRMKTVFDLDSRRTYRYQDFTVFRTEDPKILRPPQELITWFPLSTSGIAVVDDLNLPHRRRHLVQTVPLVPMDLVPLVRQTLRRHLPPLVSIQISGTLFKTQDMQNRDYPIRHLADLQVSLPEAKRKLSNRPQFRCLFSLT